MRMSITVMAFSVMAFVSTLFLGATLAHEMDFRLPELTQTGDSSLAPQSIHSLAATALIAAILICLL